MSSQDDEHALAGETLSDHEISKSLISKANYKTPVLLQAKRRI